jgi:hypothetical protein
VVVHRADLGSPTRTHWRDDVSTRADADATTAGGGRGDRWRDDFEHRHEALSHGTRWVS